MDARLERLKNSLSDREILYIILRLMGSEDAKDLSVILDVDSFVNLINVYDGSSIKVPKKDDLDIAVKVMLAFYYKTYCDMSWSQIKQFVPEMESEQMRAKVNMVERELSSVGIKKLKRLLEILEQDVEHVGRQ